jgi:hypothetical protein
MSETRNIKMYIGLIIRVLNIIRTTLKVFIGDNIYNFIPSHFAGYLLKISLMLPGNADNMFLRNSGICLQVHTALQSQRTTLTSSPS